MDLKYILKVFIIVFLILSLISFVNTLGLNLNEEPRQKKLIQVVTIEALEGLDNLSTSIPMSKSQAFCDAHKGSGGSLDESCSRLTKKNCNDTSCCVWTSNQKCAAGGIDGPMFNTDSNGATKQLDYYYFQGKCYGSGCPKAS